MTVTPLRRDLLLIAADWQSRALLVAELQEAGHEVMALPGLRYAEKVLASSRIEPVVIVLDVHADDDATPERVDRLTQFAPESRFVLIASAQYRSTWEALGTRVAALLYRPLSIGEIVAVVNGILPPPA